MRASPFTDLATASGQRSLLFETRPHADFTLAVSRAVGEEAGAIYWERVLLVSDNIDTSDVILGPFFFV